MKVSIIILLYLSFGLLTLHGQQLDGNDLVDSKLEFQSISFLNAEEVTYQVSIISGIFKKLSYNLNSRLEDELLSDETYILLDDIVFIDFQLAYSLGKFQIAVFIENLLGINNNEFTIEPNLDRQLGVADTIYFSQETSFLTGINITYNF